MEDGLMPVFALGALTMSAAQLLDLATFATMMQVVGPEAEANPLVAFLFGAYGLPMVAVAKLALVAGATAVVGVLLSARPRPRLAATVLAVGIAVGIIGGISNSLVLAASGLRILA
jgi:ABC-type cobalamin transport system permease subunit